MSDTLKEMEDKLQAYKLEYAEYKKYYESEDSWGGQAITSAEQATLTFIKNAIDKVESKTKERRAVHSTVKMEDVTGHYAVLFKKITLFIFNTLDSSYLKWQEHIISVGNSYATAVTRHETTVSNLEKHKANVANIAGSILSVAGLGTLSWLSSADKLKGVLKGLSEIQENVLEDVAQGGWDKVVSYSAAQPNNSIKTNFDSPLVFQNTIALKALRKYQAAREEILKHGGACVQMEEYVLNLQTRNTGNAKAEYEKFIKFESNALKAITESSNWAQSLPAQTSGSYYTSLQDDLECALWAKWVPGLKSITTVQSSGSNYSTGESRTVVSYDTWWWTDELCKRLDDFIDLEAIGIGKDGLDWVSGEDVRLLISWGNSFKQTVTY
jgi:hypothetical protein